MLRVLSVAIIGLALICVISSELTFKPEKRILFIGNSYTFGGDVPTQVKNIATTSTPSVDYHVEMVALPGVTLAEHLQETDALARLRDGAWDAVVLQDQSSMSFRAEWREQMQLATTAFAATAQENSTEIVYFSHWAPSKQAHNKPSAIQHIEQTYLQIANQTGGTVARAGMLWQRADDAGLDGLYAPDKHHASLKGAYAAALAIVVALGDVDASASTWAPQEIPLAEQHILRAAASTLTDENQSN